MTGELFSLEGRVAVVTGGSGVLGGSIARGLAGAGAKVGVLGRSEDRAAAVAQDIAGGGGEAMAVVADVLDRAQLEAARETVSDRLGPVDILVSAAGGNVPGATLGEGGTFFDLPEDALREVIDLNLLGTLLPCQVFGAGMGEAGEGAIVNISSMAATRVLTRVVGYSVAKSAVENLTRWLAVELAPAGVRVNAIAPGFFIGEQNRALLTREDGGLTDRGQAVVDHTPAGRFGEPEELVGTAVWLCGAGARFVTGAVVPVDGGFSGFSGV